MAEDQGQYDEAIAELGRIDDPSLRALVRAFLMQEGYVVSEAADGPAMRAILAHQPVDIIVLDVMMPGEDGLSIARSLAGQQDA
ncbi:response regulator, partial [Xylella fastidiosa subsp. multiplex]|nr:response regulator [Xylella fastidiosa subsp. multiplex]